MSGLWQKGSSIALRLLFADREDYEPLDCRGTRFHKFSLMISIICNHIAYRYSTPKKMYRKTKNYLKIVTTHFLASCCQVLKKTPGWNDFLGMFLRKDLKCVCLIFTMYINHVEKNSFFNGIIRLAICNLFITRLLWIPLWKAPR